MDTKKLNEIKDIVYEAEGLLELLHLRPEKLADLRPLIEKRLSEAAALCSGLGQSAVPEEPVAIPPAVEVSAPTPSVPAPEAPVAGVTPEIAVPAPAAVAPQPSVQEEGDASLPSFCLNDRFRFRRVIFGGSAAEFGNTMKYVSGLSSYAEAEDYFYGDMALDPDDPDVADFMEIIKNYFAR